MKYAYKETCEVIIELNYSKWSNSLIFWRFLPSAPCVAKSNDFFLLAKQNLWYEISYSENRLENLKYKYYFKRVGIQR